MTSSNEAERRPTGCGFLVKRTTAAKLPMAYRFAKDYIQGMCGRVIQSSGPLRYAVVDGMSVRESRVHHYPPRWNAAPSQELLVIRRNHRTGEVSLDPLGTHPELVQ